MMNKNRWHDGLIVEKKDNKVSCVMLYLSQYEIESNGFRGYKEGYYGFRDMVYGSDPKNTRSYKTILRLNENDIVFNGVIENYNTQELKALVG